jgi:hypothetical protein
LLLTTAAVALVLAAGCSRYGKAISSGVYESQPGSYKVMAVPNRGSFMDAQSLAYQEARNHCAALGQEMHVLIEYINRDAAPPSIELTFGCP